MPLQLPTERSIPVRGAPQLLLCEAGLTAGVQRDSTPRSFMQDMCGTLQPQP